MKRKTSTIKSWWIIVWIRSDTIPQRNVSKNCNSPYMLDEELPEFVFPEMTVEEVAMIVQANVPKLQSVLFVFDLKIDGQRFQKLSEDNLMSLVPQFKRRLEILCLKEQ